MFEVEKEYHPLYSKIGRDAIGMAIYCDQYLRDSKNESLIKRFREPSTQFALAVDSVATNSSQSTNTLVDYLEEESRIDFMHKNPLVQILFNENEINRENLHDFLTQVRQPAEQYSRIYLPLLQNEEVSKEDIRKGMNFANAVFKISGKFTSVRVCK